MKTKLYSIFALSALALGASSIAYADVSVDSSTSDLTYDTYTVDEDGNVTASTVTIESGDYENFNATASNTLTNPTEINYSIYNAYNTKANVAGSGGAALSYTSDTALTVYGSFIDCSFARQNKSDAIAGGGGAIYNSGDLTVYGDFISNQTSGGSGTSLLFGGGAIYNATDATLTVYGDFIDNMGSGNSNTGGGAIRNEGTLTVVGDFISNTSTSGDTSKHVGGGAIYNANANAIAYLSGSFINNFAESTEDTLDAASGGAIYNVGTVYLEATDNNIYFTGNTRDTNVTTDTDHDTTADITLESNAIYNTGAINFNASIGHKIVVNDAITGSSGTLTISTGTTVFNNSVSGNTITVDSGATLALGTYAGTSDLLGDESNIAVAASSAAISADLTVNGTLSLVVSSSDAEVANNISITGTLGFGDDASVALDLSEIFGNFSLDITVAEESATESALYAFLDTDLSIIFADSSIDGIVTENVDSSLAYDYVVLDGDNVLVAFDVTTGDSTITISGYSNVAVPEPSTYAMILGALALGFAYYRRRK